jgi:hypothetical protein
VQQDVPTHAQSDGPTFSDPKMIQEREHVGRALSVCDRFLGIGRSPMTASVGQDEPVLVRELVATGMAPVLVAARTAMEKQQGFSRTFGLVIHLSSIEANTLAFHYAVHYAIANVVRCFRPRFVVLAP